MIEQSSNKVIDLLDEGDIIRECDTFVWETEISE